MCLRTKNLKIFIICAYLFFIYFIKKNSLLTGLKFLNCLRIIIDIHLVCPADLSAYERSLWPTAARTAATFTPFWDEKWFGCHFVAYYDISEPTKHLKLTNTSSRISTCRTSKPDQNYMSMASCVDRGAFVGPEVIRPDCTSWGQF